MRREYLSLMGGELYMDSPEIEDFDSEERSFLEMCERGHEERLDKSFHNEIE